MRNLELVELIKPFYLKLVPGPHDMHISAHKNYSLLSAGLKIMLPNFFIKKHFIMKVAFRLDYYFAFVSPVLFLIIEVNQ